MDSTQQQKRIPPGQQLVAPGKWPVIGEKEPAHSDLPWSLTIEGEVDRPRTWTLESLLALPQTELHLDIHCVTRWSKLDCHFSGVRLADLLQEVIPNTNAKYVSFVSRSAKNHSSSLVLEQALELETLIALSYDSAPLDIGHGGPIRNIVPGRYFYKSVKWLEKIELLQEDRLGMWEAESGYHNHADPWLEERYISSSIDKRTALKLIQSKNFAGQDLRSIDATDRELDELKATAALLRDAKFQRASLNRANFQEANMSNAHFVDAKLRQANFRSADVEGADFSGADLSGADFTGASLIGASFANFQTGQFATLDSNTVLPDDVIAVLFPKQLEFVQATKKKARQ